MLAAVLFAGGKRMRPAVCLLAGKFGDFRREPVGAARDVAWSCCTRPASSTTTSSTAPACRRGRPTASTLFDNHAAVILGDYIFSQAAALVAQTGSVPVVRLFAETMVMMSMAQLAEDRVAFDYDQTSTATCERIKGKTASLFAIAAQGGALVDRRLAGDAQALQVYGENLGMAFQIVDDILDFSGDEEEMGKPVGSDLMQGTLTLPSLLLIERHPDTNPVRRSSRSGTARTHLARAIAMVRESGILEESYKIARRFGDAACDALASLPAGAPRASLEEITDYVLERRT